MGMCKKNSLLSICFVVRRVVAVGCAGIFFDIRFGHCTSCLFDNSSVKLCKHDTPFFRTARCEYEQGLGQARPNKITSKLARVADVKSRWSTTFSRIENLWPRDGSCPLPLRSKSFPGNCFRIVKTQKISKRSLLMYGSHRLLRTKFLPLFCSGVVRLAHGKRKVVARYHVQTAYEGFKVRYEESRAQCGHCVLLLSNTRITLYGCVANNRKQIFED